MGWFSDFVSDPIGTIGDTGQKVIDTAKENPLAAAALIGAGYYFAPEIGAWFNPSTGSAVAGTAEGAVASSGTGLQATGGLGLTAGNTANLASMEGAQGLTGLGTTGATLGATGGGLAYGGLGAGLGAGLGLAATDAGLATGAGLGLGALGTVGLISGGLNLAGGLLGGKTAANASSTAAAQQAALAQQVSNLGKFNPVGITNTFGTSKFTVDPTTGQLTGAGYELSPQLQAAQNTLMGNQAQNLTDLATIQNLGRGYLAQTPEQAAQQYVKNQQALLAPSREQAWANLANQDYNRGTLGLKVAQGGGLQAANPYAAALANSQAQQDLALAAQAQQAGQQQTAFGQGLLSSAYTPYATGLQAVSSTEQLAQNPFSLSTNLANLTSTADARRASNYAAAMGSSIASQQAANSYNPWATALQGAGSNPLTSYGLMKLLG